MARSSNVHEHDSYRFLWGAPAASAGALPLTFSYGINNLSRSISGRPADLCRIVAKESTRFNRAVLQVVENKDQQSGDPLSPRRFPASGRNPLFSSAYVSMRYGCPLKSVDSCGTRKHRQLQNRLQCFCAFVLVFLTALRSCPQARARWNTGRSNAAVRRHLSPFRRPEFAPTRCFALAKALLSAQLWCFYAHVEPPFRKCGWCWA